MTKILIDEAVVRQALEALEVEANIYIGVDPEDGPPDSMVEAIITLRQALADAALDKMADNAKELGLSYEQPAQQEPVAWMWKDGTVTSDPDRADGTWTKLYTTPPAPAQPITQAVQTVIKAMQDDPEYAWGWHCNIAMAFVDAGGDRYTANQGAARFLELFAKVQPAHELPANQEPDPDELTIAYMSGLHEGKKRKPWVGLTRDEVLEIEEETAHPLEFYRAIESKLKEKNT